ncbi:putative phosphoribosylaminoimidazole carboxylase [Proteus penneri ATCC 35198]|nr:putative phosphoribosylaminoimidazole carboxylase [Proteus penneri ATCC 35198]
MSSQVGLNTSSARIAIVMGSKSDWTTMSHAADVLDALQLPYHVEIVSAHRTPDKLFSFAEQAKKIMALTSLLQVLAAQPIYPVCSQQKHLFLY